jgi:hypothetical protein
MQYSRQERIIATMLGKFPVLKKYIKLYYQKVSYFFYKKKYKFKSEYCIKPISIKEKESFFGYYDKSPLGVTNKYLIFQVPEENTKNTPNSNKPINIVLHDVKKDTYDYIDKSYSYNWQQGSRLMWLNDVEFIYNSYNNNDDIYISKIYNIDTKAFRVIDSPIYDCYQDKFALSLNFDRLNVLRPDYGYRNKQDTSVDWSFNDDGIYFVDLERNISRLVISFQDVINMHYRIDMDQAKHKFNHIMISPNGKRFIFLHRWFIGKRKFDSLIVANIDGSDIKCVSDDGMVSHCFWRGDDHIFGFLRDSSYGDKYYIINANTGEKNIVGKGLIDCFGDGHPHINGDLVIFDTYPNKARMKELYLYNFSLNSLHKLGEFYEGFEYQGETRCDLHPRLSLDGKTAYFDSVHSGKRQLYSLNLKANIQ